MEDLLQSVLDLLAQRTGQLQSLEQALLDGQSAIVDSSLERMEQAQERQRSLCREIAQSDTELNSAFQALQKAAEAEGGVSQALGRMGPGVVSRVERAVATHDRLQAKVRSLNGVQQALLRRSERTVQVMQLVMARRNPRSRSAAAGVIGAYSAMQEKEPRYGHAFRCDESADQRA